MEISLLNNGILVDACYLAIPVTSLSLSFFHRPHRTINCELKVIFFFVFCQQRREKKKFENKHTNTQTQPMKRSNKLLFLNSIGFVFMKRKTKNKHHHREFSTIYFTDVDGFLIDFSLVAAYSLRFHPFIVRHQH